LVVLAVLAAALVDTNQQVPTLAVRQLLAQRKEMLAVQVKATQLHHMEIMRAAVAVAQVRLGQMQQVQHRLALLVVTVQQVQ
jgi:hypothetical protein